MSPTEHMDDETQRLRGRIAKLEAALKRQTERRLLLFRNLPHLVFLKDQDSQFVAVNEPP